MEALKNIIFCSNFGSPACLLGGNSQRLWRIFVTVIFFSLKANFTQLAIWNQQQNILDIAGVRRLRESYHVQRETFILWDGHKRSCCGSLMLSGPGFPRRRRGNCGRFPKNHDPRAAVCDVVTQNLWYKKPPMGMKSPKHEDDTHANWFYRIIISTSTLTNMQSSSETDCPDISTPKYPVASKAKPL